jgi:hypothetical protein
MTLMTYGEYGRELGRRLSAACPGMEWQAGPDFNDKTAIGMSFKFPPTATPEQQWAAFQVLNTFDGLHTQDNQ